MAGVRSVILDGLTFSSEGALHPDGYTLWLDNNAEGWDSSPEQRRDRTARLWAHGEFTERGWADGRMITLEGQAQCPDENVAAVAEDTLAATLADGLIQAITVLDTNRPSKQASVGLASSVKLSWVNDVTVGFQIQLLAADPRKYGQSQISSTGVPVDGGGLSYDLYSIGSTGVLDYGPAGSPGTVALTNTGTADTPPIHTITGSCPNGFTVTELGTGRRLVYAGAVIPGQVIRLDSADGTVTLDDDGDRSAQLVRREWVRLGKGQTGTWLFEAPNSTNAQMMVEVTPAWW
ncbi:phage distal tail protein [Arthrobacter sp. HLT1-20]